MTPTTEQRLFEACAAAYSGVVYEVPERTMYAGMAERANKWNLALAGPTVDLAAQGAHVGRVTLLKVHASEIIPGVMRDNLGLLKTHRPIVFCEIGPASEVNALDAIRRRVTYTDVQLHDTHAVVGAEIEVVDTWHHALVPFEKLARVGDLLRALGVELRDSEGAEIPVTG